MKRLPFRSLIVTLVLSLFVTGCWDRRELEDRELVVAMAIDRAKKGLNVSVQVPITGNVSGSGESAGGGSGKAIQNFHGEGKTLADALAKMNEKMDKTLFLGHLGIVLFGEEQSRVGLQPILDVLRRDPYIQRRLYPVVTRGKSEPLLQDGTEMEQIKSMFIRNMLETGEEAQVTIPFRLHDMFVTLSTPTRGVPILNYIGLEDGKYAWLGLAVFHQDRMIGTLSPDEAIPLLQIREEKVGQKVLVQCPTGDGTFQFYPLNMRRKFHVTKEPKLRITIEIEGRLKEKTCESSGKKNEQNSFLEHQVEKLYEEKAKQLIRKAQKEWHLDIFEFGHYIHAYHHTLYTSQDWSERFRNIPIEPHYEVYIRREGTSLN